MTIDSFQDTLFEDPIGLRFRHAREKARWTRESVAHQLKLPVAILEAIELEDWTRLGAPVFVRSYVGSYAKILGLPVSLADEVVRGKPVPQLVSIGGGTPTRRGLDRNIMNLAYLVITVAIVAAVVMLAMYFQAPQRSAEIIPLDAASSSFASQDSASAEVVGAAASTTATNPDVAMKSEVQPTTTDARAGQVLTMPSTGQVNSPATNPSPSNASAGGSDIVLRFRGESWVDVVDRTGTHMERGLVAAGTERRYAAGRIATVTLGNSAAVEVSQAGASVDLTAYRDANVARFTVSSDGKFGPFAGD